VRRTRSKNQHQEFEDPQKPFLQKGFEACNNEKRKIKRKQQK